MNNFEEPQMDPLRPSLSENPQAARLILPSLASATEPFTVEPCQDAAPSENDDALPPWRSQDATSLQSLFKQYRLDTFPNLETTLELISLTSESSSDSNNSEEEVQVRQPVKGVRSVDLEPGDQKLVILQEGREVSIHGVAVLQVLYGAVEVLGYVISGHEKEEKITVYSPRGYSLLTVKNATRQDDYNKSSLDEVLSPHFPPPYWESCCVFQLTPVSKDQVIQYVSCHLSQQIIPARKSYTVNPYGDWPLLRVGNEWGQLAADVLKQDRKIMLCGGPGVGKSTLFRFLVNRALRLHGHVRVIDLDPGQSEFTIPGCVSSLTVTSPLLGPSWTHQKRPDYSVITGIGIQNPKYYLRAIKKLLQAVGNNSQVPLIVNYNGYVQGRGYQIMGAAASLLQPTDLIQIESDEPRKNFEGLLDCRKISARIEPYLADLGVKPELSYRLHKICSLSAGGGGKGTWMCTGRQAREMSVLAYLGEMGSSIYDDVVPNHWLTRRDVPAVRWETPDEDGWPILLGSLVFLCSSLEDSDNSKKRDVLYRCHGWGVVRCVDLGEGWAEVGTLVDLKEPRSWIMVIMPQVQLPPSIFMTPPSRETSYKYLRMPFVATGVDSLGKPTRRVYQPTAIPR